MQSAILVSSHIVKRRYCNMNMFIIIRTKSEIGLEIPKKYLIEDHR